MYVYIYASRQKISLCATVQQVQTDCDTGIHDRVSIIRMVIPNVLSCSVHANNGFTVI